MPRVALSLLVISGLLFPAAALATAEPRQLKKVFLLHGLALSAVGAVVGLVVGVLPL